MLQTQGHWIALGGFLFVMAFKQFHRTYEGRFLVDLIVLKAPIFGQLIQNMILARFARTLSSLTASGLSIIKALKINADSIGNEVYKIEIMEIANKVKLGHTIGETLTGNKLFPSMLVNMIKVGEESAALGDVAERLAKFYEDETNEMVKNLTTLMEPIIITSLAGVVGFIMMAVMQPILALTENVG
jgi:type IV pilus assembly protein PilC